MPKPDDLAHLVLDGYPEARFRRPLPGEADAEWIDTEAERRHVVHDLEAFVPGIVAALRQDIVDALGEDITRLQHERDAGWDHQPARRFAAETREQLDTVRALREKTEQVAVGLRQLEHTTVDLAAIDAVADALRTEERHTERAWQQAEDDAARTDPETLATERRAAARPEDRNRHDKIPAAVQLSLKHEDPHLAGIRQSFMNGAVLDVAGRAIRRRVGEAVMARVLADFEARHDERTPDDWAAQKEVTARLNDLTLRFVRGLFPVWGHHITRQMVRTAKARGDRRAPHEWL